MNPEEPMSIDERRKYLHKMQDRYWQTLRKERSRMLDEVEQVTGLHRKSLIRLLRGDLRRRLRARQACCLAQTNPAPFRAWENPRLPAINRADEPARSLPGRYAGIKEEGCSSQRRHQIHQGEPVSG